jgi:hypothetical protein
MRISSIDSTRVSLCIVLTTFIFGCASGGSPEVTEDGLVRIERTTLDRVYEAPGFDLDAYQKFVVDQCSVQFRDNWLRDQNQNRGPHRRVTVDDMKAIEENVAVSCRDIFAAEFEELSVDDGEVPGEAKILTIRPAIVDLDISAPDVQSSGRETNYTTIPARMTLRLELIDSATGTIQARMIDHRRADSTMRARQTSVVGNMAETDRILNFWAALVRARLEAVAE